MFIIYIKFEMRIFAGRCFKRFVLIETFVEKFVSSKQVLNTI